MLTDLDALLFPDHCEVVEIPPHNRRIYLIQKNGSSSVRLEAEHQGWTILRNTELQDLDFVDVYLREPKDRYLSGISTFVTYILRDEKDLDQHTCDVLASRYFCLNRHYLPQWHWLVNLARFVNPGCQIRFHALDDLYQITARTANKAMYPLSEHRQNVILANNRHLQMWFLLDNILLGRCGQSLTWQQIMKLYQEHPAQPLKVILNRMQAVQHVLC